MKKNTRVRALVFTSAVVLLASGPLVAQEKVSSVSWSPTIGSPALLWYPTQRAVRFGVLDSSGSSNWSSANIGEYSFAGGLNAYAPAEGAFAFGINSIAGFHSIAIGHEAAADGYDMASIAIGEETEATYEATIAIGYKAKANGSSGGTAIGPWATAVGGGDNVAIGMGAYASGGVDIAIGGNARSSGSTATAIGYMALAPVSGGVALGVGNAVKRKDGSLVGASGTAVEPLFMLGNGNLYTLTYPANSPGRANALTVFKDGDAHFTGAVRVPQRGDISMGSYTAKPTGVQFP